MIHWHRHLPREKSNRTEFASLLFRIYIYRTQALARCPARINGAVVHQEFWPRRYERISNATQTPGPKSTHTGDESVATLPPFAEHRFRLLMLSVRPRQPGSKSSVRWPRMTTRWNGSNRVHRRGEEVALPVTLSEEGAAATLLVVEVMVVAPRKEAYTQDGRRYRKGGVRSTTRSRQQSHRRQLLGTPNDRQIRPMKMKKKKVVMMMMLLSWHALPTLRVDLSQDIALRHRL